MKKRLKLVLLKKAKIEPKVTKMFLILPYVCLKIAEFFFFFLPLHWAELVRVCVCCHSDLNNKPVCVVATSQP